MALIKEFNYDNTGFTGNYWRILNVNVGSNSVIATLGLYKDQQTRLEERAILENITFIFRDGDFPISDFNWDNVNVETVQDLEDLLFQTVYLQIKAVIASPIEGEPTRNQEEAQKLIGYEDLL